MKQTPKIIRVSIFFACLVAAMIFAGLGISSGQAAIQKPSAIYLGDCFGSVSE